MVGIEFTNYEIRAYKKGTGNIVFHFRSHLLIRTNAAFNVSAVLKTLSGHFYLPDKTKIEFDFTEIPVYLEIPFDGKTLATEIHMYTISKIRNVANCIVNLTINYGFDFIEMPAVPIREHKIKKRALLKTIFK